MEFVLWLTAHRCSPSTGFFDIVEALSNHSHGMTLTDLSAEVGLHVSTTHRLLCGADRTRLCAEGYRDGQIQADNASFEVGSRVVGGMNLVSVSRPFLEHLASATGETIHLVARHGDEVVFI